MQWPAPTPRCCWRRAVVACGWFGIQTWVGSAAIHQMLALVTGASPHDSAVDCERECRLDSGSSLFHAG